MGELKPCPACGSENVSPELPDDMTWIECDDCWHTDILENWQSDDRKESKISQRFTQLRTELDRMTAAVIRKHEIHTSGPMQGDGYFCTHCHKHNGGHLDDCPVKDARKIRVKYGFDKEGG